MIAKTFRLRLSVEDHSRLCVAAANLGLSIRRCSAKGAGISLIVVETTISGPVDALIRFGTMAEPFLYAGPDPRPTLLQRFLARLYRLVRPARG